MAPLIAGLTTSLRNVALQKLVPSLPVAVPPGRSSAAVQQTLMKLNAAGMQILSSALGSQWKVSMWSDNHNLDFKCEAAAASPIFCKA